MLKGICKNIILTVNDYCLLNQLKFYNSFELKSQSFKIQLGVQMFKQDDSSIRQNIKGFFQQIL